MTSFSSARSTSTSGFRRCATSSPRSPACATSSPRTSGTPATRHAQVIDLKTGKEAATQVGSLLLTASLSTAVNAVKGLTREEMVECLASPLREPSEFLAALRSWKSLPGICTAPRRGRYYFDRQENLTKLLQSPAHDAPDNQVDDLIRHRLTAMFKPTRKTAYDDDFAPDRRRRRPRAQRTRPAHRQSLIPRSRPRRCKNSSRVSARRTTSVSSPATRPPWAASKSRLPAHAAHKADGRIPQGHPQRTSWNKSSKPTNRI